MERRKLSDDEIAAELGSTTDWQATETKLYKKYEFEDFAESLNFINKIGALAEERDHHPDILFGWGYAEIFITTHDAGGITENDFALARKINEIEERKVNPDN